MLPGAQIQELEDTDSVCFQQLTETFDITIFVDELRVRDFQCV